MNTHAESLALNPADATTAPKPAWLHNAFRLFQSSREGKLKYSSVRGRLGMKGAEMEKVCVIGSRDKRRVDIQLSLLPSVGREITACAVACTCLYGSLYGSTSCCISQWPK